jgi:hypothetical protein
MEPFVLFEKGMIPTFFVHMSGDKLAMRISGTYDDTMSEDELKKYVLKHSGDSAEEVVFNSGACVLQYDRLVWKMLIEKYDVMEW